MEWLIGVAVAAFPCTLAYLAYTGRAQVRSCCSVDPRRDLRMRGAYDAEDESPS